MNRDEIYDRTWNGVTMRFYTQKQADLFDRALVLFQAKARFDAIMNLLIAKDSPIWFDETGFRLSNASVVRLPLYLAIKDMARIRGVDDGLLREAGPTSQPNLDDFLRAADKNN